VSTTQTIAYGMTDTGPSDDGTVAAGSVSLPEHKGGCGKSHRVFLNEDGRPCIQCAACAPALIGGHYGWAASPAGVPLTPDEQGEVQIAEREGQVAMRMAMKAMGDTVGRMVQGQQQQQEAPVLSASALAAQLAALSPAERAEIGKLLQPAAPAPAPHPAVPAAPAKPVTAARRGPGRPAKTA
jgi:hypothetical protein